MAMTSTPFGVELHAGELRLALRPDLGGSIAGLWRDGLPVVRSSEPTELASARLSGSYPLVPYSNRLGYRRFRWLGREHTTQPNFDDSPHSLHGVAWQRPWQVVERSSSAALLRYRHDGDGDWPFAFEVEQRFELSAEALAQRLRLVNLAAHAQPVGLGWHPYFPKRARSRLHIELAERWDNDASGLPVRRVPHPGIDADVAHLEFDNCFSGWRGAARIRDERLSLRLSSSLPHLVVFTPPTRPYYCVEPVSHVSNAIHMADPLSHGLASVEAGQALEAWMRLEVSAA
jgi:aldose 1-epimerase